MTKEQEDFRRGYIEAYLGLCKTHDYADLPAYEAGRREGKKEDDFGLRNKLHDYAMAAFKSQKTKAS